MPVEPMQLSGQPPLAAVGQDSQGDIHVHIEAHLTGQAIEVKELDTQTEAVLDAVASSRADDELSGTAIKVIGHEQGELGAP